MTEYLDLELALLVAARAIGSPPLVGDYGLLESALARPQASVFGQDAYPTLLGKASALLHSLVRNHCLVDGNKRLAWHATVVFCYINGVYIDAPDDDAYDFMISVADGTLADLAKLEERLSGWAGPL